VPLSKLRTSEAVRTVVDHPRRLDELVGLLEDRDVILRERAAAALASLAGSCPERLLRIVERIKAGLFDDSAYVRWHVAYALGRLGIRFPVRSPEFLAELARALEDGNRVVRALALRALTDLAARKPNVFQEAFSSSGAANLPPSLARLVRAAGAKSRKPTRSKG
jgi:HEAT repeat protein